MSKEDMSKKNHGRVRWIVIWACITAALVLVLVIVLLTRAYSYTGKLGEIKAYVMKNRSELQQFIESIEPDKSSDEVSWRYFTYDDMKVCVTGDCETVSFSRSSFGIAPSSWETGFLYTENENLTGPYGETGDFTAYGSGWLKEFKNSDNKVYIEEITDNWYYYRMSW